MKDEKNFRKKYMPTVRRGIQVLCFIFMPELFIQIFNSAKAVIMLAVHGQGTLQSVMPDIILLAAASVITMIFGRFFCGWMCAFGGVEDFIYRFPRFLAHRKNSKQTVPEGLDYTFKWIKYILLAIFIVLVWGMQISLIPEGADPWTLFGMLTSFGNWPSPDTLISGWGIAAVILLAIFAASFFIERFFCRYLCPLGAYFNIISRLRPFSIKKDRKNCGSCHLCTTKCSMGIDLSSTDKVTSGECINCMECVRHCPSYNASLALDENRKNVIVAGTVSCALITGSYYLGNIFDTTTAAAANTSSAAGSNATVASEVATGAYAYLADGTYTGTGTGFRGDTTVDVTVESGVITDISVVSYQDDQKFFDQAKSSILNAIISSQSTDVDAVSGATYSSNGIISAVQNALSGTDSAAAETSSEASADAATDTTTETAEAAVPEASSETEAASTQAASSGETNSSIADIADGTYQGTGTGLRGETQVSVTVKDGKITDIVIDSYQDDQQFFEQAKSTIIDEIISNQSTDVDAVSGATYSSNGIKEAVSDALNIAFTPSTIQNEGHGDGGHGRH